MSNEAVVIMCPPYPEYEEAPKDQSHSELLDCPMCNGKMWLSQKKKGVLLFESCTGRDIILGCYDCIRKLMKSERKWFKKAERVNI